MCTNEMTMTFLSKSANEGFARYTVASFASQLDPTLDELNDIKTIVSEAVTNCIVHAYPDSVGKIYIKAKLFQNNTIEISVRDKGCGIPDIDRAREPMFTTGDSERSGMGFTIMESFSDKMRVKSNSKGTTVTVIKRISMRVGGRSLV
ncbi:MAG: anti-sigma F factor [Clostridia bacterium]|nr:anti-sigma F factor [Clostridia bacterium]